MFDKSPRILFFSVLFSKKGKGKKKKTKMTTTDLVEDLRHVREKISRENEDAHGRLATVIGLAKNRAFVPLEGVGNPLEACDHLLRPVTDFLYPSDHLARTMLFKILDNIWNCKYKDPPNHALLHRLTVAEEQRRREAEEAIRLRREELAEELAMTCEERKRKREEEERRLEAAKEPLKQTTLACKPMNPEFVSIMKRLYDEEKLTNKRPAPTPLTEEQQKKFYFGLYWPYDTKRARRGKSSNLAKLVAAAAAEEQQQETEEEEKKRKKRRRDRRAGKRVRLDLSAKENEAPEPLPAKKRRKVIRFASDEKEDVEPENYNSANEAEADDTPF